MHGEIQVSAVTAADRERRDRLRQTRDAGLADRLLAIGAEIARRLPEPLRTVDHGDLLYGGQEDRSLPGAHGGAGHQA